MPKYSNKDCKFFGARTPEKQESTKRCRLCKEQTPDMYRECTIETNELLNMSVFTDGEGRTIVRMGKPDPIENGDEPDTKPVNNVRRVKRQEKKKMADETTNPGQTQAQSQPATPKVKSTAGVLNIAKTMLAENKDSETIMQALIAEYIKAGKTPKQAKHNAQSCLFNARKKLQPKTGLDSTTGTKILNDAPVVVVPAPVQTETPQEIVSVPVDKGPETAVEIEETTTNGTPVDDGGETEVEA